MAIEGFFRNEGEGAANAGTQTQANAQVADPAAGADPNAAATVATTVATADPNTQAQAGAPEAYTDFTLPEGVELNQDLVKQFTPIAKELKLSQENAQKLVNLQAAAQKAQAEASAAAWETLQTSWVDAAKSDKEYGGQAFDANLAVARKALDQWGTPELREMMTTTGAGNHPEMLRFFYRVGKALSEDKLHTGGNPQGQARDPAKILFPNMN